jgi:uncharacterized protein (DUF2236 family)
MSDEGYFPRGTSILRHVHAQRAVGLLYGQRALMIGALNPLAFIGTTEHSTENDHPWKRLVHTAKLFEAVFFGTRAEADQALAFTERLHQRVRGRLSHRVGPYPAGTAYSASDPGLMLWVVAPMYDSARVLYELLIRPLTPAEREQLWQEYLRFGELFGMPHTAAPPTAVRLDGWWREQLTSERIFLTDQARAVGRSIATRLPLPLWARAPMRAGTHILVGSLPPHVRERYGFSWSRFDEAALQALAIAHRTSRPVVPRAVRRGTCLPFYDAVARQERHNARTGKTGFEVPNGIQV